MMSVIPASRAFVLATGLVLATAAFATAQEATTTTVTTETTVKTTPFSPTIYVGPAFGVAVEDKTDYGWALHALARPYRNVGIQLEYFDSITDGLYVGLMPILPITHGLSIFGQFGGAFSENNGVAGGGGVLYEIPAAFLNNDRVDLVLRADYKYLDQREGEHLLVFGLMFGFHK